MLLLTWYKLTDFSGACKEKRRHRKREMFRKENGKCDVVITCSLLGGSGSKESGCE